MQALIIATIGFILVLLSFRYRALRHWGTALLLAFFLVVVSDQWVLSSWERGSSLGAINIFDPEYLLKRIWYIIPFGLVGAASWGTWIVRWVLSRRYKPLVNDYRTSTSVVVPSYREDPNVLIRCLETWLQDDPNEVILVIDIDDTEVLERLEEFSYDERVRIIPFKHHGKRSALGVGIHAARYEIVVLTNYDTAWGSI